jgi:hypothetical protein
MYVARAPRLFILSTSVCFCPVLASTREESMSITQRTEQHSRERMMMMCMSMRACVCVLMLLILLCSNRRCRHVHGLL